MGSPKSAYTYNACVYTLPSGKGAWEEEGKHTEPADWEGLRDSTGPHYTRVSMKLGKAELPPLSQSQDAVAKFVVFVRKYKIATA